MSGHAESTPVRSAAFEHHANELNKIVEQMADPVTGGTQSALVRDSPALSDVTCVWRHRSDGAGSQVFDEDVPAVLCGA